MYSTVYTLRITTGERRRWFHVIHGKGCGVVTDCVNEDVLTIRIVLVAECTTYDMSLSDKHVVSFSLTCKLEIPNMT